MDLTPERYDELQALFEAARGLGGAERAAVIAAADPGLVPHLERLLSTVGADVFSEAELDEQRQRLLTLTEDSSAHPETIGPFRIVRCIGEGGMGTVFEAEQAKPARRVALKVLRSSIASTERIARFEREIEWLGRLQHPGIAQVFETGTFEVGTRRQPYIAMEYVDGPNLLTYASRTMASKRDRVALLAKVAEAVHHAHEKGVLHRDLKPDNVLVDPRGQPKLLDFGISRSLGGDDTVDATLTVEGQILGTLGYMAPEQLDPRLGTVGPAIDVYALGVVGYELLTGRRPVNVTGMSLSQAIHVISTSEPPAPSAIVPALRGDLNTVLQKALEREPHRRYASAAALASDLWRHLDDLPIRARPPSRAYRLRKFVRRQRALVALVAVLALGLAGTLGFAFDAREKGAAARAALERESEARHELVRTLYAAETRLATRAAADPSGIGLVESYVERWRGRADDAAVLGWEFRVLEAMLAEPDGEVPTGGVLRSLVVDRERGRVILGTPNAIEVRALDDLALIQSLGPVSNQVLDLALSPDGERVVTTFLLGATVLWDFRSGERVWTFDQPDCRVAGVEWCAAENSVLIGCYDATIRGLDPATGRELWREEGYARIEGQSIAMAPDGRTCAVAHSNDLNVYTVTSTGLDVMKRLGMEGSPHSLAWSSDGNRIAFGGWGGHVGVWDFAGARLLALHRPHTDWVHDVSFSPDGAFVATASRDNSAVVLDAKHGRELRRFRDANLNVHRADWADAERLLVGGDDPRLEVWHWGGRGAMVRGWLTPDPLWRAGPQLVARRDGRGFDAVCGGMRFVFDVQGGPPRGATPAGEADRLARSASGERLATTRAGTLYVSERDGAPVSWELGEDGRFQLAWSPVGPERLAVSHNTRLWVLAAEAGASPQPVATYPSSHSALEWTADGRWLLVSSAPGVVRRMDPATGEVAATLMIHAAALAMDLAPDGRTLAIGTSEHALLLVDPMTLEVVRSLEGHTHEVVAVAWDPTGTRLASAGEDKLVRVWDPLRGDLVAVLEASERIEALAWSADGRDLVALTLAGDILQWGAGPAGE